MIGASVAGVKVVRELRASAFDGVITLLGNEPEAPYDRPPLSKAALRVGLSHMVPLLTADAALGLDIEMILGRAATYLDLAQHEVTLDNGQRIAFDKVVLATGASPIQVPSLPKDVAHQLRTWEDCLRLRRALINARSVAIVGAGFIGTEVASTARDMGLRVHLIDAENRPLSKVFGEEVGGWFTDRLLRYGVDFALGSPVEAASPNADGSSKVLLANGNEIVADVIVAGVGVSPNDKWLTGSDVPLADGVLCDEFGRVVGQDDAYAAGDVARWYDTRYKEYVRYEHWTSAVGQALTVARNLASPGDVEPYRAVPYVWSDVCGERIQFLGRTGDAYRCSVVGDFEEKPRFVALYYNEDGALSGAVVVNWARAVALCRSALEAGHDADAVLASLYDRRETWLPA